MPGNVLLVLLMTYDPSLVHITLFQADEPGRPPAPSIPLSAPFLLSFILPTLEILEVEEELWTCAWTGPWSSDDGGAVTSAPQTGCRKDDRVQTASDSSRAGPVWRCSRVHHRGRLGLPTGPARGNKMALSWISTRSPPNLLKLLCDRVPSVLVLSCPGGEETTRAGGGVPVTSALPRPGSA